jgi:hypothetical protein
MEDGRKENPGLIEDATQKRESKRLDGSSEDGRPVGHGRRSSTGRDAASSWVNWQSVLYLAVLGMMCVFLVPLTSFWWIVLLLGALDTYYGDPEATRHHERAWTMLATLAESVLDLEHQRLR